MENFKRKLTYYQVFDWNFKESFKKMFGKIIKGKKVFRKQKIFFS